MGVGGEGGGEFGCIEVGGGRAGSCDSDLNCHIVFRFINGNARLNETYFECTHTRTLTHTHTHTCWPVRIGWP